VLDVNVQWNEKGEGYHASQEEIRQSSTALQNQVLPHWQTQGLEKGKVLHSIVGCVIIPLLLYCI